MHTGKLRVIDLYSASMKIRGIDERTRFRAANGKSFVDCARGRVIYCQDSTFQVHVWIPARDRAIFRVKDEKALTRVPTLGDLKATCAVKDDAGWSRRCSGRT